MPDQICCRSLLFFFFGLVGGLGGDSWRIHEVRITALLPFGRLYHVVYRIRSLKWCVSERLMVRRTRSRLKERNRYFETQYCITRLRDRLNGEWTCEYVAGREGYVECVQWWHTGEHSSKSIVGLISKIDGIIGGKEIEIWVPTLGAGRKMASNVDWQELTASLDDDDRGTEIRKPPDVGQWRTKQSNQLQMLLCIFNDYKYYITLLHQPVSQSGNWGICGRATYTMKKSEAIVRICSGSDFQVHTRNTCYKQPTTWPGKSRNTV